MLATAEQIREIHLFLLTAYQLQDDVIQTVRQKTADDDGNDAADTQDQGVNEAGDQNHQPGVLKNTTAQLLAGIGAKNFVCVHFGFLRNNRFERVYYTTGGAFLQGLFPKNITKKGVRSPQKISPRIEYLCGERENIPDQICLISSRRGLAIFRPVSKSGWSPHSRLMRSRWGHLRRAAATSARYASSMPGWGAMRSMGRP